LGTVLYDENAPPEKKERVIHTAASTTILSAGVRLTGFQVYANAHPLPQLTSQKNTVRRSYQNISHGMSPFFPFRFPVSPSCMPPSILAASTVSPAVDVVAASDDIRPGLPQLKYAS
ncbi:hypothetical protein PISMIDRAFT_682248, partial [Pisolithus microcarpus 441]